MSFEPKDFAAVADRLRQAGAAGECPDDAAFRAAIGRYYYAALLAARDFLARSESTPIDRTERTHAWVIGKLRESADPNSLRLAAELDAMRRTRTQADYGDEIRDVAAEAERMAKRCGKALAWLAAIEKRYRA